MLRDYGGGTRSAVDSAFLRAYQLRDRLSPRERDRVTVAYSLGPGRDRGKAIAALEAAIARGDSTVLVSLGEVIREQRQFAPAESLNVAWVRRNSRTSSALGNIIELRLDQGDLDGAATTVEQLRRQYPSYAALRHPFVLFAKGDLVTLQRLVDSMRHTGPPNERAFGSRAAANLALLHGRLTERTALLAGVPLSLPSIGQPSPIDEIIIESSLTGPSPRLAARLDSAIARTISPAVPVTDRPYLTAAGALARLGNAAAARAMLARYRVEVSDTALRREAETSLHAALGEIALAERNATQAIAEFRRSDTTYDRKPVDECAACVSFHLGRAFDAANQPDSAIAAFERYLATPYWDKIVPTLDPIRVPAIHERLGQIYESKGNAAKAAEHYRAFVELWKNADPELQPRVAEVRQRLARLGDIEKR
jgi:tetratricopeptide (TPR) repeat protein